MTCHVSPFPGSSPCFFRYLEKSKISSAHPQNHQLFLDERLASAAPNLSSDGPPPTAAATKLGGGGGETHKSSSSTLPTSFVER
jgi:hypothetical protein